MSVLKQGTKRSRPSNDLSPTSPSKKQKQIKSFNDNMFAIKNMKQSFTIEKLQFNKTNSIIASEDKLFNKQPTKQSQYIRWVIACKFIIATGLRLDSYHTHGMRRNKIPQNYFYFVDNRRNLCALIHEPSNDPTSDSHSIIAHCNKIATSVMQTYHGMNAKTLQYLKQMFMSDIGMDESEDDDLWTDTIHIIRIPYSYYEGNIDLSFYWLCCKIARHIFLRKAYGSPLFGILFRTIANFDCFMLSLPTVPLRGSLFQMFSQFAIGLYENETLSTNWTISQTEFKAFLGTFDCWTAILMRHKCRKSMHRYWNRVTQTDFNIMNIVIEYSDLAVMSDERIMEYIDQFEFEFEKYNQYLNELKVHMPSLETKHLQSY